MKLNQAFYRREDVTEVAKDLLGKVLVVQQEGIICSGRIVETEAYSYSEKACHAYLNRFTERSKTLFAEGGTAYVYLCYGIHRLFNVVTNTEGLAEAVLIRAVEPLEGVATMHERRNQNSMTALTSGPGKLSQAMGIEMEHNKLSLLDDKIWIEADGQNTGRDEIITGPRIGVDYAGEDALLPWRYGLRESRYLSKPFK